VVERLKQADINSAKISLDSMYEKLKTSLCTSTQEIIPIQKEAAKQKWMTPRIMEMMEERREAKGNEGKYQALDQAEMYGS